MSRSLGSFSYVSSNSCTAGGLAVSSCWNATISGVPNRDGSVGNVSSLDCLIKVTDPVGTPIGTYVTMSGGGGNGYAQQLSNYLTNVITPALTRGWRVIQPIWAANGGNGYNAGTEGHLALLGRSATMLRGLYDNFKVASTPFVVMGQSGGAEQTAGALGHYGADSYIDMAILCSGPPMANYAFGILGPAHPWWAANASPHVRAQNGGVPTAYGPADRAHMDAATGGSACTNKDVLGSAIYFQDQLMNSTVNLRWPHTDVRFVLGDADTGPREVAHWFSGFVKAKSKSVDFTTGSVQHVDVPGSTSGAALILAALDAATLNH